MLCYVEFIWDNYQQRFTEALTYAKHFHAKQIRKGSGVPYIAHLLGVASIALEYGAKEEEALAALLHDVIEDQGGDFTRQEMGMQLQRLLMVAPMRKLYQNRLGEKEKKPMLLIFRALFSLYY